MWHLDHVRGELVPHQAWWGVACKAQAGSRLYPKPLVWGPGFFKGLRLLAPHFEGGIIGIYGFRIRDSYLEDPKIYSGF